MQLAGLGVLAVSVWLYLDSSAYLGDGGGSYLVAIFVLMAAGALMVLVGMLGCCGALQESPCLLGTVSSNKVIQKIKIWINISIKFF